MRTIVKSERGEASVQNLFLLPVLLLLLFTIVQFGMIYHANNVASAAATAAYNAARLDGGTASAGHAAAATYLSGHGNTFSSGNVQISRTSEDVSVVVTGNAPMLVPLWAGPEIRQEVSGPTERWISR